MRCRSGVPGCANPPLRIVLVEPEIPGNTGTIGRLAMATGCPLHLVEPLGFSVDAAAVRRAGLDYWPHADIHHHDSFAALLAELPGSRFHLLSTHAPRAYTEIPFRRGDLLVFGKETRGLDPDLLQRHPESCFRIPMWNEARSLNLAVATGIVVYEGLRQLGLV
ncbi:MAG: tRNA (cytidine(34)-2'-O)-methyltransferase [Candidatus Krumholzibacteriia bacterium]